MGDAILPDNYTKIELLFRVLKKNCVGLRLSSLIRVSINPESDDDTAILKTLEKK